MDDDTPIDGTVEEVPYVLGELDGAPARRFTVCGCQVGRVEDGGTVWATGSEVAGLVEKGWLTPTK